jgi:hypothetical protein
MNVEMKILKCENRKNKIINVKFLVLFLIIFNFDFNNLKIQFQNLKIKNT